jgi:hypothetical protein
MTPILRKALLALACCLGLSGCILAAAAGVGVGTGVVVADQSHSDSPSPNGEP